MTLASFGCALVMTACFLAWVPRKHTWFTTLGAGTVYAYLLHVFPVQLFQQSGRQGGDLAGEPAGRVAVTLVAAAGMTALCTAPVRRVLRFAVEPGMGWFFNGRANSPAGGPRR